jgi:hypothetical protein
MEQTLLIKGIALMSALTSIQQWLLFEITLFDIMFVVLVVAFLLTLERDYLHYMDRRNNTNNSCLDSKKKLSFFLNNSNFFSPPHLY